MSILNPCGAENLEMEFALVSKYPIARDMIIPQDENLVIEVYCLKSCNKNKPDIEKWGSL